VTRAGRALRHRLRAPLLAAVAAAAAVLLSACGGGLAAGPGPRTDPLPRLAASGAPPPPGGYFTLEPVGSYASLPSDATAAAQVHRSTWEVRPGNRADNQTTPVRLAMRRVNPAVQAYDPRWNTHILGRITGDFTGTTDEIFQWAAAKWGLPTT